MIRVVQSHVVYRFFGDRWTLLIIRQAFLKTCRFDDFQKQLGITRHLLTERLNRLVEHHIFEKVLYQDAPKRYEYQLTEKGLALYPILMSISAWGNVWLNENKQFKALHYKHQSCGQLISTQPHCAYCQQQLSAEHILPIYL